MRLRMDLDGIIVEFQIQQYTGKNARTYLEHHYWCNVSFSFLSEPWLNYRKENDEVFLSFEVDELAQALDDLLNDNFSEIEAMEFVEPDFHFKFFPKEDLRKRPNMIVSPGHEILDISMEWSISFWHDGLTANHLAIVFDRNDIVNLKNYLFLVIGKYDELTPEIVEMRKNGILY